MHTSIIRFLSLVLLPTAAAAQEIVLHTFTADGPNDAYGVGVDGVGDVDGDGYDDVIVGAHNHMTFGQAKVYSGFDGHVIYEFLGTTFDDDFGISVAGAGDVDADGFGDFVIGVSGEDGAFLGTGAALVYSGHSGTILHSFEGDAQADALGWSVDGAGDVNADGYDDIVVGAPDSDVLAVGGGTMRVYSGFDGSVLYTFHGPGIRDHLGIRVAGAGDVDNDGYDDVIGGAWEVNAVGLAFGYAVVYSGQTGALLHTFQGDNINDRFGQNVDGAGDVNGDGYADLIVGAPHNDANGNDAGMARVFSGLDGSVLYTFLGTAAGDDFGLIVAAAGDADLDGFADFFIGSPSEDPQFQTNPGVLRLYSGASGSIIDVYEGVASEDMACVARRAGDVNADGVGDFILGCLSCQEVRVLSGQRCLGSSPSFCDASDGALASCPCANPGDPETGCDIPSGTGGVGLCVVEHTTSPNHATLRGVGFPANATPAVVVIRSPALDPSAPVVFGDGLRCVSQPVVRLGATLAMDGASIHSIGHGAGSGTFYYQLWFRSLPPNYCTVEAFSMSNGRAITW